jgi:molybdopterin synthase catalytic subunit/molybdopterin synthase sulfur carrier subunit
MKHVEVLVFARLKELAGTDSISVNVDDHATLADLRKSLATLLPDARPLLERCAFVVESQYIAEDTVIADWATVACIPPVSGGAL